jgi:Tfp pilus assembly protein PilF
LPESAPTGRASSSTEAPAAREPRAATAAPSQVARSTQPPLADSLTVRKVADPERQPVTSSADSDFDLALRYHRAGDFEHARQHYLALLQRNELDAQAHNNLGLLYQQKGLLQDSARELHRAVALEPGNAGTHNNYGVTLLMQGRKDEAVAEFQSALTMEPGNLDARINLALAERSSGRIDVAKENLLDVLNRAPANAPAHYNLAQLYDQTNEPARAVEHYRLFLEHAGTEHADRAAPVRARIAALSKMPE